MFKYKCEYFSKITGKKEIAMMPTRNNLVDIVTMKDIDLSKEIKVFEKRPDWELAYYVVNGKRVFKDFLEDRVELENQQVKAVQQQEYTENLIRALDKEICTSRLENQSMLEIIFDSWLGEDISKPKLQCMKGK